MKQQKADLKHNQKAVAFKTNHRKQVWFECESDKKKKKKAFGYANGLGRKYLTRRKVLRSQKQEKWLPQL